MRHKPIQLAMPIPGTETFGHTVDARPIWKRGVWAVHTTIDRDGSVTGYSVTHVPSGRAATKARDKNDALALAKRLAREAPAFGKRVRMGEADPNRYGRRAIKIVARAVEESFA